jgi:hypothetical protein
LFQIEKMFSIRFRPPPLIVGEDTCAGRHAPSVYYQSGRWS